MYGRTRDERELLPSLRSRLESHYPAGGARGGQLLGVRNKRCVIAHRTPKMTGVQPQRPFFLNQINRCLILVKEKEDW